MLNNIPAELRALPQWVNWRYELVDGRKTKVPYSPTGRMASVTDPTTWVDFNVATQAAKNFDGIGFVLAKGGNYTIIDLDNKPEKPCTEEQLIRHTKIYEAFDSYAERSTSGTGVHIIVRGTLPSGVHRDNVEAYSDGRYMICTGDVLRDSPIKDCQALLDILYGEMKPPATSVLTEVDEILSDEDIVNKAMRASNADKFNALCAGDMTGYPSQSEADFALLSIIAFYTQSNEQVRRIFRTSALGKRTKATRNNTYIDFALEKVRAQQPAPVDMEQMAKNAQAIMAPKITAPVISISAQNENKPSSKGNKLSSDITFPPGLIGETAQYFYDSSFMQIPEVALAASIAMFGAFAGRQYNINGQGLSHYLVLLAETGKGKEGAATGIDRIFSALRTTIPMSDEFRGPAVFASGPALTRVLSERPSQLSIQGEFGFTINRLNNAKPGTPESTLKQILLDAYTKSSWTSTIQSSVYSDKEKNTAVIQAPNLNILGESTQTRFFEGLDITSMEDGLIPRLLLIESRGLRPYPNRNHGTEPSRELLEKISTLIVTSITMSNNRTCCHIPMDEETTTAHWQYTDSCIDLQNRNNGNPVYSLWSRAAATTTRLAGLIAVGVNPYHPIVTMAEYGWAKQLVERSIRCLTERFHKGDIGEGDSKQMADVRRLIEQYFEKGHASVSDYISSAAYRDGLIPYSFLIRRTSNLAAFRNDPLKSTGALKKALQALIDSGDLIEIPKLQVMERYKHTEKMYGLGTRRG